MRLKFLFLFVLLPSISSLCNNNLTLTKTDTLQINNDIPLVKIISSFDTLYHNDPEIYDLITTIKILDLKSDSLNQLIIDTSYSFPAIFFKDINLDNYVDIELSFDDDRGNSSSDFWLYDTSKNKYVYSKSFSGLENYEWNPDSKMISTDSHSILANGSFNSLWSDYWISGNDLILTEQNFASQDQYSFVSGKIELIKGIMKTTELDSIIHLNNNYIFKRYYIFSDSLLISSIYWTDENNVQLTDSSNYAIYCESQFTGTVKSFKKENYFYKLDDNGRIIPELKVYEVRKNKWELINN